MKYILLFFLFISNAYALNPGETAINFKITDQTGSTVELNQFTGKYIVLEWYNKGCPYVRKHYDSKNMQSLQKLYKDNKDVVWISIISSAKGKQGYLASDKEALENMKKEGSFADHIIRDVDGKIGQAYGATSTPHIFIIGADFKVKYAGAIDSIASANKDDILKAKNYITASLSKLMLSEKPDPQKTTSYGCSVKY